MADKAFLKDLTALSKSDVAFAGGKGASLGEMTRAGISVPPGYVILSGAFEKFLEETDLNVEFDAVLHAVNHQEIHTVEAASEKIQALILAAAMPADIGREIERHFKKLGAAFVAVRSSATAEDSSEAAWAGQLDSFLNTTKKNLLENVKRCWASLFTPRAIFYRFEKGLHKQKISVAVVVQKMVQSEVSGIAFSVHPVTEDRNQLIIEAGLGLGEAVVSGQITPDSYVVEKTPRRIIDKNVSEQERGLFRQEAGGNVWENIPAASGAAQKLSDKQILELAELVLRIENHYGFPCDIEWALEGGKFYITQSRPITTLALQKSSQEKVTAKSDDNFWVENFSCETSGYNLISAFLEFGMWNFQKLLFGKDAPLVIDSCFIDCKGVSVYGYYPEKQVVALVDRLMKFLYDCPEAILKNHRESYLLNDKSFVCSRRYVKSDLSKLTNKKLFESYIKVLFAYEKAHERSLGSTWYVDSYGGTFANDLLEKTKALVLFNNSKHNPAEVFTVMTTSEKVSFGQKEQLESLKVLEKIVANKKAKKIFSELSNCSKVPDSLPVSLKKSIINHHDKWCWTPFGYMGPAYGLDYYLSVWSGLVKEKINVKKEIKKLIAVPKETRARKKVLIKQLNMPKNLQKIYEMAADVTFLKGYRKDSCYYAFFALDKILREVSRRTGLKLFDIHMLTHLEVEDLLLHNKKVEAEEFERRKKHAVVILKDGALSVLSGDAADEFIKGKNIKKEDLTISADSFKGTCACSGFAKGVVRVVNKPEEMHKMNQGDIMVSHTTFPSLVPAMKKAAAIVTEDGGITCHAAIVARELKTPCVTGIKVITQVVKDGDVVEVDADAGVVKIVKKA